MFMFKDKKIGKLTSVAPFLFFKCQNGISFVLYGLNYLKSEIQ